MFKNPKTTILGICTILAALANLGVAYLDGDPATVPDLGLTLAAILSGIAAIKAADSAP